MRAYFHNENGRETLRVEGDEPIKILLSNGKPKYIIYPIHIIARNGKWAVTKPKRKRAIRVFKYRELAFLFAVNNAYRYETIVTHNEDGSVLFTWRGGNE